MTDFKEPLIGDHLSPAYSPRLRKLGIKGSNVRNIAIGAFAGISSERVDIFLEDTNINNIPTAIFFPGMTANTFVTNLVYKSLAGGQITDVIIGKISFLKHSLQQLLPLSHVK